MSQRILGLDIGASSVKAAVLETSFRSFQLVGYAERSVRTLPDADEREARREVLRQMVAVGEARAESVLCALPGDKVMSRILTLPFGDPKRIESVLGFELESYLPLGVDQMVYDYQVLHRTEAETTLLAAAVQRDFMADFLDDLKEVGIDPKIVSLASLAYLNLWEHLKVTGPGPVAIVDIGARTTQVCVVVDGKAQLVRTLRSAGDALTTALADDLGVDWDEAERIKCERGLLPTRRMTLGPDDQRIADACARGVAPLLRDLRQTFQAYRAQARTESVGRVVLCGGTSRLLGLPDYLEDQLGVEADLLSIAGAEFNKLGDPDEGAGVIPKALALALRATGGRAHADLNFRQGPFAYQGDFQFLRDKMLYLVLLAVMLVGTAGFKAYARYQVLEDRRQQQLEELQKFSKAVLGKEKDDYDAVLRTLNDVPAPEDLRIFPDITATQVFYDVTTALQDVNATSKAELAQAGGVPGVPGRPGPGIAPNAAPKDGEEELERPGPAPTPIRAPGPSQVEPPGRTDPRAERLERLRAAREAAESSGRLHTTRGPDLERLRAERLQQLRSGQPGTIAAPVRPGVVPAAPVAVPTARPGLPQPAMPPTPATSIRTSRDATREADRRAALEAPGAMPREGEPPLGEEGSEAGAVPEGPPPQENLQVELEEVRIEEAGAFLKGQANTIEALELFAQKLEAHRCLRDVVTADTDKVTFSRHQGWLQFRLEMTLDCKEPKKVAKKDKPAAQEAD